MLQEKRKAGDALSKAGKEFRMVEQKDDDRRDNELRTRKGILHPRNKEEKGRSILLL